MSKHPRFGHTRAGLPVHARVIDHHKGGFNKHVAIGLTAGVGNMRAFWIFNLLSLLSLPATLVLVGVFAAPRSGPLHFFLTFGWIYLITWVCQNYIQLVLLPALMVGQNLQNEASDARAAKQFEDTEQMLADVKAVRELVAGLAAPKLERPRAHRQVAVPPETAAALRESAERRPRRGGDRM